jgi:hypothetical protein
MKEAQSRNIKQRRQRLEIPHKAPLSQNPVLIWSLAGATFLGAIAAALTILPRVVVSPPTNPINPKDALSVSFDVTNTGLIPLGDVGAFFGVGQIEIGRPFDRGFIPSFKSRLANPEWQHHQLGIDDRFTVDLSQWFIHPVDTADIAIGVTYSPWVLPLRREKLFRFVAMKTADGTVRWKSWPLNERPPGQ